jgi:hypothetical protein
MERDCHDPAIDISYDLGNPLSDELAPDVTCLGSTCMKWGGDGELAPQDLQAILARLSEVDAQAQALMQCPVDPG